MERVVKSRQIPAAAAGPLLLPAPFLWAGAGGQLTQGRVCSGLQSPSAGNWGTWDWPAKVDPIPCPHLHPRFGRGVASAPGPWRTAGYAAAKAGGEDENPGRCSQTKRRVGCALPSGLTSQKFLRDSVCSEPRNKIGPNLTILLHHPIHYPL